MKFKMKKELDEIIAIIKKIQPKKVYVFGSYASGAFDDQSDIDLLIVASSDKRPLERCQRLRRMLSEYDRRFGLDLLYYTPDEFEILEKDPSSFVSLAIREGTKVYDSESF